jgi:hypothetical protein
MCLSSADSDLPVPVVASNVTLEEIETETLQVDARTVRTTTPTFGRDGEGRKTLVQVTEEENHRLPGGDSNIVSAVFTSQTHELRKRANRRKKWSSLIRARPTQASAYL